MSTEGISCVDGGCSNGSSSSSISSVVDTILSSQEALLEFIKDHCKGPTVSSMRNWTLYTENLRAFIVGNISKTEFDHFVLSELKCISENQRLIHLHNAYILSIVVSIHTYIHTYILFMVLMFVLMF